MTRQVGEGATRVGRAEDAPSANTYVADPFGLSVAATPMAGAGDEQCDTVSALGGGVVRSRRSRGISCLSETDSGAAVSPRSSGGLRPSPSAAGAAMGGAGVTMDLMRLPEPGAVGAPPAGEACAAPASRSLAPPPLRRDPTQRLADAKVTIGDFEFLRAIGKGAYSVVCVARYKPLGRLFALKRTKKSSIAQRPRVVQYLEAERWCLNSCHSPFIVRYCGSLQDAQHVYFVLEYCDGGELFNLLCSVGAFAEEAAKFYVAEVIVALETVHAAGIAYRDLKPENIMLDRFGHVKLVDFGFAVAVPPGGLHSRVGTAHYVAPEMLDPACLAAGYGTGVDVWSLGCLIYELLVGRAAFGLNHEASAAVHERVLRGQVLYPAVVSPIARSLLQAMLERNLAKRLTSLADVKAHRWFLGVDWVAVAGRRVRPPFEPALDGGEARVLHSMSAGEDGDGMKGPESDDGGTESAFRAF